MQIISGFVDILMQWNPEEGDFERKEFQMLKIKKPRESFQIQIFPINFPS